MNIAEYIVNRLVAEKIKYVFGYQGGNITYVIDAIGRQDGIDYVQTYNEQGASFAANAYAQVTENFGVAVSSSGPGAINMINGIANAYYDSIPCLFITGNINTMTMRKSEKIRQNGFQEADIVGMVKGITKYAVTIREAEEFEEHFEKALQVMKAGRPGPVLLDIPHNIQRMEFVSTEKSIIAPYEETKFNKDNIENVVKLLSNAIRPVIVVGGGCKSSIAKANLLKFLQNVTIPVVSSLQGIDVLPNEHDAYRGMIGSYGFLNRNQILNEADVVLVLGSRLDERQRSVSKDEFLQNATVIHVDIDENELKNVVKNEISILMKVELFLEELNKKNVFIDNSKEWFEETKKWINELPEEKEYICGKKVYDILRECTGNFVENVSFCVDVGNHQMAMAQAVSLGKNSKYLNSGGLGSMGYALPAVIGAYYGDKEKKAVCISGDGGIMMNVQELQLVAREKLPVAIFIINNSELGMIRSYQNLAFEGRNYGAKWGYLPPDFYALAKAFGMEYKKINETGQWNEDLTLPAIIEIEV